MKIKGLKSALGTALLTAAVIVAVQYQNCAPAGTTGAFILGSNQSASTGAPPVQSTAFSVGSITLPSSTFQVSAAMTATAVVTNGGSPITCNWSVLNSTSTVVSTYTSTSTTGVCNLSLNAPSTVATYTLQLSVTSSINQTTASSISFTTQAAPVSTTVSASLTLSQNEGYIDTVFTLTGQAVSNTPQLFTVVIGSVSGGVKTPFTGCSFSNTTAATTYSPSCNVSFAAIGVVALYLDVTSAGQTLDCQAVTGNCQGAYSIDVIKMIVIPPCFIAGTPVETPQGQIAIEKIKVGDKVFSFDTATQKTVIGEVGKIFVHKNRLYGHVELVDGTKLSVTPEHRFYLPKDKTWKAIGKLKVGDVLQRGRDEKANPVAIKSLDFSDKSLKADVYNFHVKKYLNYYVDDVLVHNEKF